LTPRQVRLAFSTVVKLSPPAQVTIVLTKLLQRAQTAQIAPLAGSVQNDEQLTYFLAFVDCLPWLEVETVDFWLDQLVFVSRIVQGRRKDVLRQHIWDTISGVMGGEVGMKAVEWWVNKSGSKI
jgi:hypothetical protein